MLALDELLKSALTLGEHDRAALAEQLLASLDEDAPSENAEHIEALWTPEAQRRLTEHRAGSADVLTAEAVAEQAQKRFR